MHAKDLTCVLLAGGKSTRLGAEKASLPFGRGTLTERAVRKLKALSQDVILVGNPKIVPEGVRLVEDVFPGRGPLGGIHAGLAAARSDKVLVFACDIPFAPVSLLRFICDTATAHENADAVVPQVKGEYEPTVAVYSKKCLKPIEAVLEARDRPRIIEFFPQVRVFALLEAEVVRFGDPELLFFNVNSKEDYLKALGILGYPPVLCVSGPSGSGKTTLICALVKELVSRGRRVAVIKHHRGDFDLDIAGKDTWLYREAGAKSVGMVGSCRSAFVSYVDRPLTLSAAAGRFCRFDIGFDTSLPDLVLAEGFASDPALRLVVLGRDGDPRGLGLGNQKNDPSVFESSGVMALVTGGDSPIPEAWAQKVKGGVRILDRSDSPSIADFIEEALLSIWERAKKQRSPRIRARR
ncbi:MAG TPA: molybdopterin-guanine dinucleotide biosynthesis protein B [Clostridia bacterium]|nr:molybdopterin-guanine dinucleotide biosynthesis protein B [Clostridia bacterium]